MATNMNMNTNTNTRVNISVNLIILYCLSKCEDSINLYIAFLEIPNIERF